MRYLIETWLRMGDKLEETSDQVTMVTCSHLYQMVETDLSRHVRKSHGARTTSARRVD
jgi:hypothetical protein